MAAEVCTAAVPGEDHDWAVCGCRCHDTCPHCRRAECTGEDCYWAGTAAEIGRIYGQQGTAWAVAPGIPAPRSSSPPQGPGHGRAPCRYCAPGPPGSPLMRGTSRMPIAERVARGAALLDERDPGWWRLDAERPVDLDALNIADGANCICGQRSGNASYATYAEDVLGFDDATDLANAAWYGFFCYLEDEDGVDAAWCELIESRRAGEPS